MKLIAIIPAKKHSRRLENKNFRLFFKRPIIYYPCQAIEDSEIFDKVVVSTDLAEEKRKPFGGDIFTWHQRPEHLCSDTATVDEVCLDVLEKYTGYDYVCCIYPTAYAVTWQDLCKSFVTMLKDDYACCSYGMLNGEYSMDNGGFYWCRVDKFIEIKELMKIGHLGYDLPMVDINTIEDFAQAKLHALTLGYRYK